MLLALTSAFALSQAYRTVAAIMAPELQAEFGMSAQALGVFAGAFHFAFGSMQLFMGVGIDLHGVRRTVLAAFPLAIAGSLLSALANGYGTLLLGQVLIGIGCAPAFLVCTVFIARHIEPARFAAVSGIVLAIAGLGMLATGTPLAWLIEASSWRAGFLVLGLLSIVAWLVIFRLVHEPEPIGGRPPGSSIAEAVRGFGALFKLPHTPGILALSAVTYAAFISLRGLWLGPLLVERHAFSLVQSGHVALAVSLVSMLGPVLFGRLDPGPGSRRRWIVGFVVLGAGIFAALAWGLGAVVDVAGPILFGLLSGFIVLQYADVRSSYPTPIIGRALALFTMAMFLGVAVMQWLTGVLASLAAAYGLEPYAASLGAISLLLLAGALAYARLPGPDMPAA
jgi:MFS family permease